MESIDPTQLAGWLAETDIDLLTLDAPTGRLRLRRGRTGADTVAEPKPPAAAAQGSTPGPADGAVIVTAPSVGVFLDAHPLRPAPFVRAGAPVVQDQFVGLLRIGALLLPVRAPCAGTVGAPFIAAGTAVGYGTPLLGIRPHAAP